MFLLREHFRKLGLVKDRYWPLVAPIYAAAAILNQNGQAYLHVELRSWWQKNWPCTYTQIEQKQEATDSGGTTYDKISDGLRRGSTGSQRDGFWFTHCSLQSVSPVSLATVRRPVARPEAF